MQNFYYLQILYNKKVEARIKYPIFYIENWLNRILSLPRKEDIKSIGIVIADTKIEISLKSI